MEIPENIGNYRIECLLGSGGMAEVYLATHVLLNKQVAIKVMKPQLSANDPMMAKRFVREAQLAQKVDHPNIVKVFDVGCDEKTGLLYIVMEYVEGMNLSDYSCNGDVSSDDIRAIAHEMTQALIALQELGIVHRDIKPSNIMLCNDGSLKLMDLGIAKALHPEDEGEATLTVEQAVLGTPAYSSPEQCMNSKTVDIRSDIYCLGASLYAIASGRVPYGGTTAMEILLKVLENKPQPLSEIRPDLDADLIAMIEWMMEKSPDRRPQTPRELLDALVARKVPGKWKRHGRKAIVASVALVFVLFLIFLSIRRAPASLSQNELNNVPDNPPEVKQPEPANERPSARQGEITQQPKSELVRQIAAIMSKSNNDAKRAEDAAIIPQPTNDDESAEDLGDYKKHVTLEERLADVEEKIAKEPKSSIYTDSEINEQILKLAKETDYVSNHFNEFKALVHQVQRFRIKEQIKRYEFAKNLDRSKFDAEATREVQESFAAYAKEQHDWKSEDEFSKKLLSLLKSGKIDPNVQVVNTSKPQFSGPLLSAILSGSFQKKEELVSELLKLGVDVNEALEKQAMEIPKIYSPTVSRKTSDGIHHSFLFLSTIILTNGGVNRLENSILPLITSHRTDDISELLLLNHDVHEKDTQGNTALHYAVQRGMFGVIALLIASGADINARNKNGETPLFNAVKASHPGIIKLLLDLGADANIQNKDGKTALAYRELSLFINAAMNCDIETMQKYLDKGFSPDTTLERNGQTLLQYACGRRNEKMVELLLKYNADTELTGTGSLRYTPLAMTFSSVLSRSRHFPQRMLDTQTEQVILLLLKYGADPNTTMMNGRGPSLMDYIILERHTPTFQGGDNTEMVKILLKLLLSSGRAKFANRNNYAWFFTSDKKEILEVFLENTKEFSDDIPILVFALTANVSDDMINTLMEKKANVNCVFSGNKRNLDKKYLDNFSIEGDTVSRTALYIAVERRRLSMVKLLLAHGADKDFVNESGKSIRQLNTTKEIKALLR